MAAISHGELPIKLRSVDLRMGKPGKGHALSPPPEHIGREEGTGGTETSQYPEEEKSSERPVVVASEAGRSPNRGRFASLRGCRTRPTEGMRAMGGPKALEGATAGGESPVGGPRGGHSGR